jgi:hypothetical protein
MTMEAPNSTPESYQSATSRPFLRIDLHFTRTQSLSLCSTREPCTNWRMTTESVSIRRTPQDLHLVDLILGGALPAALSSAMICSRHSIPYAVKAGTPSSPTP